MSSRKPKLKECPFCGNKAEFVDHGDEISADYDICCGTENCYLEEGAGWRIPDMKEVAKMWNTRKPANNLRPDKGFEVRNGAKRTTLRPISNPSVNPKVGGRGSGKPVPEKTVIKRAAPKTKPPTKRARSKKQ